VIVNVVVVEELIIALAKLATGARGAVVSRVIVMFDALEIFPTASLVKA
jgi:hypothetical protein